MRALRVTYGISTLCISLLLALNSPAQQAKHYKELTYPKLRDVMIPDVQRVTLPNGLRLYLLEDHEFPLIHISAIIRVDPLCEPADKVGLASITGEVMRTGGTTARTGDQIDALLGQIAASVETHIGLNLGFASASALRDDIDTVLSVLADVLMRPAFRNDKIQLAKMKHRSAIARRNDSLRSIASREFRKLIYGPESVYARHTEYATINRITRDDLVAFHKRFFGPNNMMLAAWGDLDADRMIQRIDKAFEDWAPVTLAQTEMPKVRYTYPSTVSQINRQDANQSRISLGHIGGIMSDPDYFTLVVVNEILGSTHTGRLFKSVRSRQGLAYSVFGHYSANVDYPGVFFVGCQAKSGSTAKAIGAMLKEVKEMTTSLVTDEELALAKDSYLNSFVFDFDSKGEIAKRLMSYDYYGYPADFLERTKANVEKVTKEDVLRAAQKHLHPDQVQILVVGRVEDFDESLSVFGKVEDIDITIPTSEMLGNGSMD